MECFLGLIVAIFGAFMVFLGIIGAESMSSEEMFLIPGIGLVFILIGIYVFISRKHKFIAKMHFWKNKVLIEADIIEIYINKKCRINGEHPYTLLCHWVDTNTGLEYNFRVGKFIKDPTPYIESTNTTTFPIFILPENPNHYDSNFKEFIKRIQYQ